MATIWEYCEVHFDHNNVVKVNLAGATNNPQQTENGEGGWLKVLGSLGQEGWELVGGIVDTTVPAPTAGKSSASNHFYQFKRPKK
jgi:hypothetical protein